MTDEEFRDEVEEAIRGIVNNLVAHEKMIVRSVLSSSAVLKALSETLPGFYESYERHLKEAEESPYAPEAADRQHRLSLVGLALIERARTRRDRLRS